MKKYNKYIFRITALVILIASQSCKDKTAIPTLTTVAISEITQTSATSGGKISDNGGSEITARGVCWNTSHNPDAGSEKSTEGSGNGTFVSSISGLAPDTKYYVRAYATNSKGTAYGNELSFTTTVVLLPQLTTTDVTGITSSTAISGGNIISDGGGNITARGPCWNTSPSPVVGNAKNIETGGIGTFVSNITSILPSTKYYVRAYATNSAGTNYGNEVVFTTHPEEPFIKACYKSMTFPNPSGGKWIWGQNVSIGDTAFYTLAGVINNYDVPWCESYGCCDNSDFNGISISIHTLQSDISYKVLVTGGLSGGPYFADGFIKIPTGWAIDSVHNSSNNPGTGADLTITDRSINFHCGTDYAGCVCSDCGRANISLYISKH
jgi:hypothetical protein